MFYGLASVVHFGTQLADRDSAQTLYKYLVVRDNIAYLCFLVNELVRLCFDIIEPMTPTTDLRRVFQGSKKRFVLYGRGGRTISEPSQKIAK